MAQEPEFKDGSGVNFYSPKVLTKKLEQYLNKCIKLILLNSVEDFWLMEVGVDYIAGIVNPGDGGSNQPTVMKLNLLNAFVPMHEATQELKDEGWVPPLV